MAVTLKYKGRAITCVAVPTKSYKTFLDYMTAIRNGWSWRVNKQGDPDYWQCRRCDGRRVIIAPYEKSCPVEGYKMADRIECPTCNGTGSYEPAVGKAIYKAAWEETVALYKKESQALSGQISRGKAALEKLTEDDIDALLDLIRNSSHYGGGAKAEIELSKRKDFTKL